MIHSHFQNTVWNRLLYIVHYLVKWIIVDALSLFFCFSEKYKQRHFLFLIYSSRFACVLFVLRIKLICLHKVVIVASRKYVCQTGVFLYKRTKDDKPTHFILKTVENQRKKVLRINNTLRMKSRIKGMRSIELLLLLANKPENDRPFVFHFGCYCCVVAMSSNGLIEIKLLPTNSIFNEIIINYKS